MNRLVCWLALFCTAAVAVGQQPYDASKDNAALTEVFTVDHAARQGKDINWEKLRVEDRARRDQVRHMLDQGEVRTGGDYFHAALIFQHGEQPEDYLLAHILASTSVALGDKYARWLAAATLDRYLVRTGHLQVFGTQFGPTKEAAMGMLPMDSSLLSDSVRRLNCVVSLPAQESIAADLKNHQPLRSTSVPNCP